MADDTEQLLTRDDVARWLKVRPREVTRLGVPCLALGRKTVRYRRREVERWLEQLGRQAVPRLAKRSAAA